MYGHVKGLAAAVLFTGAIATAALAADPPNSEWIGHHLRGLNTARYSVSAYGSRCGVTKKLIESTLLKHMEHVELEASQYAKKEFIAAGGDSFSRNWLDIDVSTTWRGEICATSVELEFDHATSYYHRVLGKHVSKSVELFGWNIMAVSRKQEHAVRVKNRLIWLISEFIEDWEKDNPGVAISRKSRGRSAGRPARSRQERANDILQGR